MALWDRFRKSLEKTRSAIWQQVRGLFGGNRALTEAFYDELEETLILADVGVPATERIIGRLREYARREGLKETAALGERFAAEVEEIFGGTEPLTLATGRPTVILVVGVNGVGKTTSLGKLAARYRREGQRVLLVAGDTFRAAAAEQLNIWAERAGVELLRGADSADPGAVVYDGLARAKARHIDVVLIDTAGRLHNKTHLIEELKKVRRVAERELPGAPDETLLVLDATVGQNGLNQARVFQEAAGVTGLVLAKIDGTARGGIALAIREELGLPIKWLGTGEGLEDLEIFDPSAFASALLGSLDNDSADD